eukprot:c7225_g1_i3.p1 GENE.c7225_g1_i3~~c7225_g1_i3.p1  ORF type:complete len:528 (+),score=157.32 c7225_g1_i3:49-1584(+)
MDDDEHEMTTLLRTRQRARTQNSDFKNLIVQATVTAFVCAVVLFGFHSLFGHHSHLKLLKEIEDLKTEIEKFREDVSKTPHEADSTNLAEVVSNSIVGRDQTITKLQTELTRLRAEVKYENILPPLESLLLDEIPFENPADISDSTLKDVQPFDLHRVPDEEWYYRAKAIMDENQSKLKSAQQHVDDPEQRVTLVTVLFDLGRDKLADVAQFKRKFDEYLLRLQRTINVNFPMILFINPHHVSMLNLEQHTHGLLIIPWSVTHLEQAFPNYFSRIEEIRHSALYKKQAQLTGWLSDAPQAALKDYNLLVMVKPFLLRWVAQVNPWRTQYLMFVDAGHDCIGALKLDHLNRLRQLMGRMMVTYFDYFVGLGSETHGMPQRAYRNYVGFANNESAVCCEVVRGGIFGGTPAYIDVFAKMYNIALSQTLSDGYMGTEENVLGMLSARFPSLFNSYKNVRDNCDVFVDAGERDPSDSGVYVQGEEPDKWDADTQQFVKHQGKQVAVATHYSRIQD